MYFIDVNLLYIFYEGNVLEDLWVEYLEDMFTRSVSSENVSDKSTYIEVEFEKGDLVVIDGVKYFLVDMFVKFN